MGSISTQEPAKIRLTFVQRSLSPLDQTIVSALRNFYGVLMFQNWMHQFNIEDSMLSSTFCHPHRYRRMTISTVPFSFIVTT